MKNGKSFIIVILLGIMISTGGCSMEDVEKSLDNIKEMEYKGGAFENDIKSARAYLLQQMEDKYGEEFFVVDNESLKNYGPLAGASYGCNVAPISNPDYVARAIVSQTLYQNVQDNYAVYFFKNEAEAPIKELCNRKSYVLDQRISLEAPLTEATWSKEDGIEQYLSDSGAYVEVVLRLEDGIGDEYYAEQLIDFLESAYELNVNILLQAKADKMYVFYAELDVLGESPHLEYSIDEMIKEIEENRNTALDTHIKSQEE